MGRKCPPGVICLENMTMVFIVIIIGVIFYFVFRSLKNDQSQRQDPNGLNEKIIIKQ